MTPEQIARNHFITRGDQVERICSIKESAHDATSCYQGNVSEKSFLQINRAQQNIASDLINGMLAEEADQTWVTDEQAPPEVDAFPDSAWEVCDDPFHEDNITEDIIKFHAQGGRRITGNTGPVNKGWGLFNKEGYPVGFSAFNQFVKI